MSEYQYYEFQAIDRPLTEKEMGELRSYSTRARITPTSFVNDYSWGNFKGDDNAWMEKYFDAFLYLANWGTHVVKLRLPTRLLNPKTARLYCGGEHASVREKHSKLVLTFLSEDEEDGEWGGGEGHLGSVISVRAELARGDVRGLYLAWLLCAQGGELDDDELEPPVPAGLAQLSASLEGLAEFLRIDTDLVGAAATTSPPLIHAEPKPAEVQDWLAKLPVAEKDAILARLIAGSDGVLVHELVQRMKRGGDRNAGKVVTKRRTVAELLRAAQQVGRAAPHRSREGRKGEGPARTQGRCRPRQASRST
jgi:hypothetical protein